MSVDTTGAADRSRSGGGRNRARGVELGLAPLSSDGVGSMLVIDAAVDNEPTEVCPVWYGALDDSSDEAALVAPPSARSSTNGQSLSRTPQELTTTKATAGRSTATRSPPATTGNSYSQLDL